MSQIVWSKSTVLRDKTTLLDSVVGGFVVHKVEREAFVLKQVMNR